MLLTLLRIVREYANDMLLSFLHYFQSINVASFFSLEAPFRRCHSPSNSNMQSLAFGPTVTIPSMSIHSAFVQQATKYPDQTAVKYLDASYTYSDLKFLSNELAVTLVHMGVKRGDRVVLLVSRSFAMITAIFGTLKAGASYVPLDGGIITDQALRTVLEDAKPAMVLCSSRFFERMDGCHARVLNIEEFLKNVNRENVGKNVEDKTQPSDEAYVIYTSGTTGLPKGVSVSHENVTNLILTAPGNLSIQPGTRVSQLLNIAFDMAVWEILGCLCNAGTLVLRPSGGTGAGWESTLREIDVMISTPSILSQFNAKNFPNVRVVATAGEPCPQKLADEWAVGRTFLNCCGPTETTIINTAHLHKPGKQNTIGRPTSNNAVYVLDEALQPVPIGTPGLLWAGGRGVCRGYVGLPSLTAERFRPDPFCKTRGVMYNTGDIGRLRPDGEIDHLGRVDDQIKIKGFRVELDGVAAAISLCPGVYCSAALLSRGELWGFYSPKEVSERDVKTAVERVQPYYAVPVRYVALERMPLTINGKVDKPALRTMVA